MQTATSPQLDPTFVRLIEQTARTEAHVLAIKGDMTDMKHKLFGNGKIGALDSHDLRISAIEQAMKEKGIRKTTITWLLRLMWGLLLWMWGVVMGNAPHIKAFLRAIGW